VILAEVTSCKGTRIYAFASGLPTRVARLADTSEAESVRSVKALNLTGSKREEGSGHALTVKTGKGGLEVLRIDARCGGAPWQASCSFWRLERDSLARSGVCSLPQRLDARALRAAGWR
jgi:hypothetical protein